MRQILTVTAAASMLLMFTACGGSKKDEKGALTDKKVELEKLKKEQQSILDQIAKVEDEIVKLDPTAADSKAKLVALTSVGVDTFAHYIDLQGKIDAKNVGYVAPRGPGGNVRAIYVTQGQNVRKGQVLVKLDDAVAQQGVTAAQQQLAGLESQVKLTQSIYERQQNLWKQNIGTEVQVLTARTNAEAAVSQLNAAKANVRLSQEQANLSTVVAEMSGTIDQLNVRVGEFFSGAGPDGKPQMTIVNTGDLKVLVQVPENYLGKVSEGSTLEVTLPEAGNKSITTKVSVAGKLIDPNTRSFYVEGKLPQSKDFRPNQIALVRIKDYASNNAITIPMNTLQTDEKGKFVLVAVTENGKLIARKKQIAIGELYGANIEVKNGLQAGDKVITEGFQGLYDGQFLTTQAK